MLVPNIPTTCVTYDVTSAICQAVRYSNIRPISALIDHYISYNRAGFLRIRNLRKFHYMWCETKLYISALTSRHAKMTDYSLIRIFVLRFGPVVCRGECENLLTSGYLKIGKTPEF